MAPSARVIPFKGTLRACEDCSLASRCLARDIDNPDAGGRNDVSVTTRIVHRGEHLFRSGASFRSLYMVRSGSVKTYMLAPNGDEQVIGFHGAGDLLGLDAIDTRRYACSAKALDTSSVCVLGFDQLARLCRRSKTVQCRFLNAFSAKLLHDESMLLMLGQKSADQRIATFLLEQADRQRQQGYSHHEVVLSMSRADIGSYLALAVETVSRVLTRLQESGVLKVRRNRIQIADAGALRAIAEDPGDAPRRVSTG